MEETMGEVYWRKVWCLIPRKVDGKWVFLRKVFRKWNGQEWAYRMPPSSFPVDAARVNFKTLDGVNRYGFFVQSLYPWFVECYVRNDELRTFDGDNAVLEWEYMEWTVNT